MKTGKAPRVADKKRITVEPTAPENSDESHALGKIFRVLKSKYFKIENFTLTEIFQWNSEKSMYFVFKRVSKWIIKNDEQKLEKRDETRDYDGKRCH